ncbi:MAG TPA: 3-dehydroquinate synthase [Chitinophagaceae bacterium]
MKKIDYEFSDHITQYFFDAPFSYLQNLIDNDNTVIITDENVFKKHKKKFTGYNCIVLKPGEAFKVQSTADAVIQQLIDFQADRKTMLVGVGGGVVTDLTGYVASVYMRGLSYGFVPTTVLSMVDAAIGGKNGINVGLYKNLVGSIRQPQFLLYDFDFLRTLPKEEWNSGFAEIIKHACINDAPMFRQLEKNTIGGYKKNKKALATLIQRNALLKSAIAKRDEHEQGDRKLLNFGHTLGHALENIYELTHGQAISIGMVAASRISQQLTGFKDTEKIITVLKKYGLPVQAEFDKKKAFALMKMDKKKVKGDMHFILLQKIGKGVIQSIPVTELQKMIN